MSESAVGGFINFTNLKKESQPAVMAMLTGRTIDEDAARRRTRSRRIAGWHTSIRRRR